MKCQEPCGIQVARTESLLFRLLKAVFIPMTIRYFLFLVNSRIFRSWVIGEPLIVESCNAHAAANSISRFEIVLSSVLPFVKSEKQLLPFQYLYWKAWSTWNLRITSIRNLLYSMIRPRKFPKNIFGFTFYILTLKTPPPKSLIPTSLNNRVPKITLLSTFLA